MKIEKNFGLSFSFEKDIFAVPIKSAKTESTQKEQTPKNFDDIFQEMDFISLAQNEKNSKVDFKKLPDGISRYEHKGARYTIFKHDDEFSSEFYCPKGTSRGEFFNSFSSLEPETITTSASSAVLDNINGEIDETVLQGNSGDCWLLVAINSLNSTQTGKQIIKDSITINDDNTVTVSFRGIGVSYTLSANEISKYDTDDNLNDSYSNGDNDMLILELATEKLWSDINSGRVKLPTSNESINMVSNSIEDGGLPYQMIYYLTGIEADEYCDLTNNEINNIDIDMVYEILDKAANCDSSVTFGIYNGVHTGKLIDGSEYTLDVSDGGHALSIKNITDTTVTFVNPWDNSIEYTMTKEEFANFGIGYISYCDLSNVNYQEKMVDMTGDSLIPSDDCEINDNYDSDFNIYDRDFPINKYDYSNNKTDIFSEIELVFYKFISFLEELNNLFGRYFLDFNNDFSIEKNFNRKI